MNAIFKKIYLWPYSPYSQHPNGIIHDCRSLRSSSKSQGLVMMWGHN
jgi:hypothetical protein